MHDLTSKLFQFWALILAASTLPFAPITTNPPQTVRATLVQTPPDIIARPLGRKARGRRRDAQATSLPGSCAERKRSRRWGLAAENRKIRLAAVVLVRFREVRVTLAVLRPAVRRRRVHGSAGVATPAPAARASALRINPFRFQFA